MFFVLLISCLFFIQKSITPVLKNNILRQRHAATSNVGWPAIIHQHILTSDSSAHSDFCPWISNTILLWKTLLPQIIYLIQPFHF